MIGSSARTPVAYAVLADSDGRRSPHLVRETGPAERPKPRLLDRVRGAIRARHRTRSTEESYVGWIRRYIFFYGKRHPAEMGGPELTRFHTHVLNRGPAAVRGRPDLMLPRGPGGPPPPGRNHAGRPNARAPGRRQSRAGRTNKHSRDQAPPPAARIG